MGQVFSVHSDAIPDEGLHLTTSWDSTALAGILEAQDEPFTVLSPVELDIRFLRSAHTIIAEGSFNLKVQLQCVRCLNAFAQSLTGSFRYRLLPASKTKPQQGRSGGMEDSDIAYYADNPIDMRPLIREQIYLLLPEYPHCSEQCRGLCPRCGANLNETACACAGQPAIAKRSPFHILKEKKP